MIYELVFTTSKRSDLDNTINFVKSMNKDVVGPTLPTGILATCQQIHNEALNVLRRMCTAKFTVKGWRCYRSDLETSTHLEFRKLHFEFESSKPLRVIEYGGQEDTAHQDGLALGCLLHHRVIALANQAIKGIIIPNQEIRIEFKLLDPDTSLLDHRFHDFLEKPRRQDRLWFRAQAAFSVERMRDDLRTRLSTCGGAVLVTSNVEGGSMIRLSLGDWMAVRVSTSLVQLFSAASKKKWALELSNGGVIELCVVELD